METIVIIGWLLLTLIPMVGYLVVSGINAKLGELKVTMQRLNVQQDIRRSHQAVTPSKSSKRVFNKLYKFKGNLIPFRRK